MEQSIRGDVLENFLNAYTNDDYKMVVAIDFGTAFSGYAFSLRSDQTDITLNRNWGHNVGTEAYKTPTCILFNSKMERIAFGYEAQKTYSELDRNEAKDYYFFEFFKMELHKVTRLEAKTSIIASNGREMSALVVFSEALRYLKDHFLESVKDSSYESVTKNHIRWVITVPAIWSFKSKGFMRVAALQAELITEKKPERLVIALEPESASIFCRNLAIKHFVENETDNKNLPTSKDESKSESKDKLKLPLGTRYILLDAGGGTLDVTVHEVEADNRVKEIHFATGDALGGMYVDKAFTKVMEESLGEGFITQYKKENPTQWLDFMIDFEQKKRACKPNIKANTKLKLSYSMGMEFSNYFQREIATCKDKKGVRVKDGMISISHDVMVELFKDIVQNNVSHIEKLLTEEGIKNIKYLFMVGGFSNSELLQNAIKETFGPMSPWKLKILIPIEASVAVMKGAVTFGHNPSLIKDRKANLYYGVKVLTTFDHNKHDAKYKRRFKGKDYIYKFDVLLKKGATLGFEQAGTYHPLSSDQDKARVAIYATDKDPVVSEDQDAYIDDRVLKEEKDRKNWLLGEVVADWPGKGFQRDITVYLSFGGTEIDVRAVSIPGDIITKGFVNALKSK